MVGGVIIQGLKQAVKLAGKKISKAAVRVSNSWVGRAVTNGAKHFGAKMAKRVNSKRWWGRAVRVIRSNKSMLGAIGKLGSALKKSGGFLGLFGRGMSIFDVDFRSPKEFRKSIKAKEIQVDLLKKKRDQIIAKEREARKEFEIPVVTEGVETPEEKLDEMSKHLSIMKKSLGDIKAKSSETSINLKGFETYQIKANESLSEAIDYGTQTNMKTLAAGLEDVKDVNKAIAADSAESIVGEINAKIESVEEERKREEEIRRKRNWIKKLINFTLFVADWILNWPWKLTMLALKVGAFITAALGLFYLKNMVPIKALIKAGPMAVIKYLGSKWIEMRMWISSKIVDVVAWLYRNIIAGISKYSKWIGGLLSKVPVIGKYVAQAVNQIDNIEAQMKEGINSLRDSINAGLESVKQSSKENAKAILDEAMAKYTAEAKEKEAKEKSNYEALKSETPEGVASNMKGENSSPQSDSMSASSEGDKEEGSKFSVSSIKDSVQETANNAMDGAGTFLAEHDVSNKVIDIKDKVISKTKEVAVSATESVTNSDAYKELKEHSDRNVEKLKEVVKDLGKAVTQTVAQSGGNGGNGGNTVSQGPIKTDFEESANKYKARL